MTMPTVQEWTERHASDREGLVETMVPLFIERKVSAVLLGDRLTKWEVVEVLRRVQGDQEAPIS